MIRLITTALLTLNFSNAMDSQPSESSGGDQLLPVKQALISKLINLMPRLDKKLSQPIQTLQEGINELTPSSNQRGVIAVNHATMLVLWDVSLNSLKHYIDLSKSLVILNQMLLQQIQEQQTPVLDNLANEKPKVLDGNPSQKLISRLSILTSEIGLVDDSTNLINGMRDFMGMNLSTKPAISLTQDMTIITLWNFTLDRLKNYIDLVDALTGLKTELLGILDEKIIFSADDLKRIGFDILNLPGFIRKCFEGACHFVSGGKWGRTTEQFTRDVNTQRDKHLAAIGSEIVTILTKNNPEMRKKAITAWLKSTLELSRYLDVMNGYFDRAIKQKPNATAEELLNLMRQLKRQDEEEEERRLRESSSDDHADNPDILPDIASLGKNTDDNSAPRESSDSPDFSSMGETISRGFEGPGWSSLDERAFQAGNQFDQDMPSGREITENK
ncbi:MAG: hypothetical protein KF820_06600 [Candidatus Paracaedibacteraceae bacterium]|nr:hypothetical protein [Candidatus Paracaedibacteraceae bacterium]